MTNFSDEYIMRVYQTNEQEAKEMMVNKYTDYVYSFLWKSYGTYVAKKENRDDFFNSCIIGLLKAMKRYDAKKGAFTTFVTPYMKHEITNQLCVMNEESSTYYSDLSNRIAKAKRNGAKSISEIARSANLSEKIVKRELAVAERKKTVCETAGHEYMICSSSFRNHGDTTFLDDEFIVNDMLSELDETQKDIIQKHVLNNISFCQIAREYHTTPYEIKKIYQESISILRKALAA